MANAVGNTCAVRPSRAGDKWHSPEYKREQRRKKAEREGRELQHRGIQGEGVRRLEREARAAWKEWLELRAPAWWLAAYEAQSAKIAFERERARKARDAARERSADRHHMRTARYQARKYAVRHLITLAADGSLSTKNWSFLFDEAKACGYCAKVLAIDFADRWTSAGPTIDHILPLSRGGIHGVSNVAVVCRGCNSSKGERTLAEWMPTRTHAERVIIAATAHRLGLQCS